MKFKLTGDATDGALMQMQIKFNKIQMFDDSFYQHLV